MSQTNINSSIASVLFLHFLITSCGEASFGGGGKGKSTDANPDKPTALQGVDWYWQCDEDTSGAPAEQKGHKLLVGTGEHQLNRTDIKDGVPVSISGKVCQPATYPRDIVFVIDVSLSMADSAYGNDKYNATTKSCNRLKAIETVMDDALAQNSNARFGIVTFTYYEIHSTSMFQSKESLYADIANVGGKTAPEIICGAIEGTNYNVAMSGAEAVLNTGRAGTLKELYFITDGVPDPVKYDGLAIADRLKTTGVTINGTSQPVQIAATMIGVVAEKDDKSKLLASIDQNGKPLHAGSVKAKDLAATLRGFSENRIDDGILKYRNVGDDDWTSVQLKENMNGLDFTIPAFTLSPNEAPEGLEVSFEYKDSHNNVYTSGGTIKWESQKK